MRQRVRLPERWRWWGGSFIDEPFRADHKTRLRMEALLQEHTQEALKILVTHDLEEAQFFGRSDSLFGGATLRIVRTEIQMDRRKNA